MWRIFSLLEAVPVVGQAADRKRIQKGLVLGFVPRAHAQAERATLQQRRQLLKFLVLRVAHAVGRGPKFFFKIGKELLFGLIHGSF